MSPDPDQQKSPAAINNPEYLTPTWCLLPWTPWVPFSADKEEFPGHSQRTRPLPHPTDRQRRIHVYRRDKKAAPPAAPRTSPYAPRGELMPWSEPMTEAPALWAWQDAEGFEYQCSAAPLDASAERKTGDGELSPLPVPAGTRWINALQLRAVPPAVPEINEPEGKPAGRETRRGPSG